MSGARCEKHGLVVPNGRLCVLCRRDQSYQSRITYDDPPRRWPAVLLAAALIGAAAAAVWPREDDAPPAPVEGGARATMAARPSPPSPAGVAPPVASPVPLPGPAAAAGPAASDAEARRLAELDEQIERYRGSGRADPAAPPAGFSIRLTWDPALARADQQAFYGNLARQAVMEAYGEVSQALGIDYGKPLAVHVHSPAGYRSAFGIERAQRSGAHYGRGQIHFNGGATIDQYFKATLRHELVHALYDRDGQAARLPAWLNEGVAEWIGLRYLGESALPTHQMQDLQRLARQGQLLPLQERGFLGSLGYVKANGAVVFLVERHGARTGDFVQRILKGESVDQASRAVFGRPYAQLMQEFQSWVLGTSGIRVVSP